MRKSFLALMTSISLCSFVALIAGRYRSSTSIVSSSPVVFKRDSASAVRYFTPARWMTSNSDSKSRNRYRASFPTLWVRLKLHSIEMWSCAWWVVCILNKVSTEVLPKQKGGILVAFYCTYVKHRWKIGTTIQLVVFFFLAVTVVIRSRPGHHKHQCQVPCLQ